MPTETFEFQVEARQLLQLMIHSVYSNKDVFLRELVSNASDALDKLRLEKLRDDTLDAEVTDLHIEIDVDKEARTLTVRDNGIGMSYDEVGKLIGTIANSGTATFLKELKEAQDEAGAEGLIGQFGVGFYSGFMVADEMTLVTRRAGESQGTRWTSRGEATYTLETVDDAPQGTSVTLHLKPADPENQLHDYTSPWTIKEIVKRYSDFITWPIRMAAVAGDGDGDSAPEPETLNSMKALWARSRDEVSDDEYHELYKHISHDWREPLETIRLQAEGTFEYQSLLFIPSHAPHDLFTRDFKRGVQLYVKRVFIMDDCEALLPPYLRFVKGVVDAADLSLNVSREILQQDRHIRMMQRRLTKKVLSTVKEIKTKDADRYATFWREFGTALKEGLVTDPDNSEAILAVASFATTHDDEPTTLAQYVERMKDGQDDIYYITGESRQSIENSPHMEAFRDKGIEVLLLTDAVDEVWVDTVGEYEGKKLRSVAKGEIDLDTEGDDQADGERAKQAEEYAGLLGWMGEQLGEDIKEVRLSTRLTVSPACVVSDAHDLTPALENMYRAMGQEVPRTKRILELNADHLLVKGLNQAYKEREDRTGLVESAELLHTLAVLAEGGQPKDPARFVKLVADRLERTL
ncbi:molecular chaperone HtpG [Streptomyces cyaneochromogenes]|uniref:Chaperone protein HtpG n=1 Tax=Streptomyces cyaneochromogenes TaxID=2496836 RepID=A0A3S9MIZ0_9ACTN|nr:molecular chaperone HtpG [Streptomyces cyaneochromogenes]AZQ39143.1 molecular chaperone HtpG [Streptomyces cyaneochromogenes]